MLLQQVVVAVLAIGVLMRMWKGRHLRKLAKQIKNSLWSLPFIGHSYLIMGNDEQRMKGFQLLGRTAIKSGGITTMWHLNKLYIMVADPEVAAIVLKNCLDKDDLKKMFHVVTGDGSIFTSVSKWRPRRKFLAPTFNMKNLNRFVEVFSAQSRFMVEKLINVAGKGPFSMWEVASTYTMDAVCGTTLGIEVKAQENPEQPFLVALDWLFQNAADRVCQPWLQSEYIFRRLPQYQTLLKHRATLYGITDEIITEKRKANENDLQHPNTESQADGLKPFVQLMLESAVDESDVAIREECLVILGAGTDTSAVAIGYTTVMLARYPEVQEKVYQEVKEVFGDSDRPVVADDLHRFKYLDAVIRETIRLYPPVPIITRKVTKEVELPSGVTILPGCGAIINIWAVHRNPSYWGKDADEFRPERFLESAPRHPAAFMPFSYGPRNCLGYQYALMSIKTALATLLMRYRIVPASTDELKHEPLRVKFDIMMRHVGDYCIRVEARK